MFFFFFNRTKEIKKHEQSKKIPLNDSENYCRPQLMQYYTTAMKDKKHYLLSFKHSIENFSW